MKRFFSFLISQTVAILLIVALILGFGVYSTVNMPINLLPDINVPMICVYAVYPGANAKSVETDVTEKLEDGLSSISGVTDVSSYSYDNLSALVLSFDYGTDTTDKKADINAKVSGIELPSDVTTTVYDIDLNAEALAVLSVTSDEGATEDEKLVNAHKAADELAVKLRAIDGVESVEIKGGPSAQYVITPIAGLELVSPLLVQAFSYGALDIPLGNIMQNGVNVQIRNNSDVGSEQDIKDMPLTLPSQIVSLLSSVKNVMGYYEDSTTEELKTLRDDLGTGVIVVLGDIDDYSSADMENFASLKTYMNIASSYKAEDLKSFKSSRYYHEILSRVEGKTDDELVDIAEDIKNSNVALSSYITVDMLKVVRDGKIDTIINYREKYVEVKPDYAPDSFYTLTSDDYYVLETGYVEGAAPLLDCCVNVYSSLYDVENPETITTEVKTELYNNIDFALKTSATGLSAIADKKRDAEKNGESYSPTNSECALLFAGADLAQAHPIITSPTFIAFVRSDAYESNMELLIKSRGDGEDVTPAEFNALYESLDLSGVFEFKLSEPLFEFIDGKSKDDLSGGTLVVKTSEIADIAAENVYSSYVYYADGNTDIIKGAIIEVYKSNGANSSAVVSEVKTAYEAFATGEGRNAKITLLDDQSEFISDSVSNVLVSMLIGGVLAVIVIFLFLKKWRTSLIVAITMPLSVLAALICLNLMGITLNMVSLGGLAVGIGMLVDNSIVVIESITKHRDVGKSAFDAAVDGTTEVGGALIGSTLTTVCVFIPIIFSGGLTGEIFVDLSWAVIFSLSFSLLVAVSVIPALYALFNGRAVMSTGSRLKKRGREKTNASAASVNTGADKIEINDELSPSVACVEERATDEIANNSEIEPKERKERPRGKKLSAFKEPRIMNGVSSFYGRVLPKVLGKKLITCLTAVLIFASSVGMLFVTGTEFLPSIDKGQIEVSMSYASGTELSSIQSDVSAFAEEIKQNMDNIGHISVSVGKNGLLALTDTGVITVQLTTNRHTDRAAEKIRELADAHKQSSPSLSVATVKEIDGVVASLTSGSDDMSVTILGPDGNVLREIADRIKTELENDASGFKDVKTSATDTSTQYTLRFDRNKTEELGLDYQTLVLTLRIGIASYTACTANIDGDSYDVAVRFEEGAVKSPEDLENFVVGANNDDGIKAVKLKDILKQIYDENGNPLLSEDGNPIKILVEEQESCIRRFNGQEMISVSATLPGVDTGTASKKLKKTASAVLSEYEGYSFEESGITTYLDDAFSGLIVALIVSFVLLYGVMAAQFGSALKPLIIMSSIPFSFTGGFLALVITGTRLNVVSFIGLIMLMGVVVNNAIVMLEKIKQLHDDGMSHYDAVIEACKVRLRPIFMTTLTTILALIPLAIGVGQGSELMQPLGIVVMGGLLIGTLVTLIIVPTVYSAIYRLSKSNPNGKNKDNALA